jgi:hypothetical protein
LFSNKSDNLVPTPCFNEILDGLRGMVRTYSFESVFQLLACITGSENVSDSALLYALNPNVDLSPKKEELEKKKEKNRQISRQQSDSRWGFSRVASMYMNEEAKTDVVGQHPELEVHENVDVANISPVIKVREELEKYNKEGWETRFGCVLGRKHTVNIGRERKRITGTVKTLMQLLNQKSVPKELEKKIENVLKKAVNRGGVSKFFRGRKESTTERYNKLLNIIKGQSGEPFANR